MLASALRTSDVSGLGQWDDPFAGSQEENGLGALSHIAASA